MAITDLVKTQSGLDILSASENEEPRQIWGRYLYEGELGILFGDSNTGKSILANDIAFFVSGGGHEWPGMTSPNIPSLYIDMEMTARQFANRYRNAGEFIPRSYRRAEVNVLGGNEAKIFAAVKSSIILQQSETNPPKFIIIDNITNGFGSIFSATKMRGLISELKTIKDRFGLTILLIAHCPKRKPKTPITDNDLGGSKMIINFVDSAFAIAPSQIGKDTKYIKQIKNRIGEKLSDVMTVKITSEPYLCMQYVGMIDEDAHINPYNDDLWLTEITPEMEIELVRMLSSEDMSYSEIANALSLRRDIVVDYAITNNL